MYGRINKLMACEKKQTSFQEYWSPSGMDLRIGYLKTIKYNGIGWNRQYCENLGNRPRNERNDKNKINRNERYNNRYKAVQELADSHVVRRTQIGEMDNCQNQK
jgi:hypothetical protein